MCPPALAARCLWAAGTRGSFSQLSAPQERKQTALRHEPRWQSCSQAALYTNPSSPSGANLAVGTGSSVPIYGAFIKLCPQMNRHSTPSSAYSPSAVEGLAPSLYVAGELDQMTFEGPFKRKRFYDSADLCWLPGVSRLAGAGGILKGWMSIGLPLTCPKPSSSIQANSLLKLWVWGSPASAPAALFFLSNSLLSSPCGQQALCREGNRVGDCCPTGPLVAWIPVCTSHQGQHARAACTPTGSCAPAKALR